MKIIIGIALGAVAGFAIGHGVAMAQSAAGQSPLANDVWNTLITSGPLATLLGFILWRVDSERRQLQKERDALLERVLTGLSNGTTSIQSIAQTNSSLLSAFNSLAEFIRGDRRGP